MQGRGLGTYLARLLTERYLNGSLSFASDAARGTRFALVVPEHQRVEIAEVIAPVERISGPVARPLPGAATVLIVDDSRTSRSILTAVLSREHHVIAAASGEEGLALALEQLPDLILLDVVMPGLDGFAVCARLKSDPTTEEIPVLFLSALGGEADETLALEAGAIDFITKPISPVVVAARVRNHLELKRSKDLLRDLSLADGLTGIANRRRFDRQLESEWQRTRRRKLPLAVIMGDVDHFKLYNDTYGHGAGDGCLKVVASCFASSLQRPGDLAARYGGEEFVCILPETTLEGAMEVAQRICESVAALGIPHSHSSASDCVTVSLGVAACHPSEGGTPHELLAAADAKLYEAKSGGRNRAIS
jgi:diguanylate cyclase (GGDEF)-like protein